VLAKIDWDAASVIVSAVGLLLVAFSLWQVKRSLDMSTIGNLYGSLHSVHSAFIDHPTLRPYFYHKVPLVPEEVEEEVHLRARAIAEMFLDTFEHIYALQPWAPRNLRPLLIEYVRQMCASSPFLRMYLLENRDLLHPPELLNLVQREELRSAARVASVPNPEPQPDRDRASHGPAG
jgi:hypothetical protein